MPALLDRLLVLQASRCFFCDKLLVKEQASVEHLVPLARKGADQEHNAVACCKTINGIFGSIELKAKLQTILKYRGKFVCPAILSSADGHRVQVNLPPVPVEKKPNTTTLTQLALKNLRRIAKRPRTKNKLAHHLSTIFKSSSTKHIEQVINRLVTEGHIATTRQGKVTYHLLPGSGDPQRIRPTIRS